MSDLEHVLKALVDDPSHEPPPVETLRAQVRRRTHRRRAAVALVAVIAVALPVAVMVARTEPEQEVTTAASPTTETSVPPARPGKTDRGLPVGFDASTAPFVFSSAGDAAAVVAAYVADRLPLGAGYDLVTEPGRDEDRFESVRWITVADAGSGDTDPSVSLPSAPGKVAVASGWIYLRKAGDPSHAGGPWGVIAATTTGVDVAGMVNAGSRVDGPLLIDRPFNTFAYLLDGAGRRGPGGGSCRWFSPPCMVPQSVEPGSEIGGPMTTEPGETPSPAEARIDLPIPDGTEGAAHLQVRLIDRAGIEISISEVIVRPEVPTSPVAVTSTSVGSTTSTTALPPASSPPTTAAEASPTAPPWAQAKLPAAAAPATVAAWKSDGSPGAECPALAPADLGAGMGATARATDRGKPDAWWVAYDLPGAPGEAEVQDPTADAGKETFSVSAVGATESEDPALVDRWPNRIAWSDGSRAGYGIEGDGELPSVPGVPDAWLAYVHLAGSPCLYQVHTYLGRAHLEHLIANLRFVETAP